ncbi:MAG: DUF465 domain-containing protein [Mucispirillum sp.]|nr:DUF465 domain-containing protein [Mucispirillum sp.]
MTEDKFELYERISKENTEFKKLFDEHIRFEQDLEALYSLKYFPPEVEIKIKEIKRRKLLGKDRMEQIIASYQ